MKIIGVLSGKGGVGKTTVSTMLAKALAKDHKVGVFDADITGSNIITAMGGITKQFSVDEDGVIPAKCGEIEIYAIAMYKKKQGTGVPILRDAGWKSSYIIDTFNTLKFSVDYLVVDFPPGVSDEILELLKRLNDIKMLVVTTGDKKSVENVKDTLAMLKLLKIPLIGVVENMSFMEHNGQTINLFDGVDVAKELKTKVVEKIPFKKDLNEGDFENLARQVIKKL